MGHLGRQVWQWISLSAESSYGPSLLNLLNMKIASFLHPDLKRYRVIDTALVKTHKCDCQGALHPYCRCALSCFPFGFLPKQLVNAFANLASFWLVLGFFSELQSRVWLYRSGVSRWKGAPWAAGGCARLCLSTADKTGLVKVSYCVRETVCERGLLKGEWYSCPSYTYTCLSFCFPISQGKPHRASPEADQKLFHLGLFTSKAVH